MKVNDQKRKEELRLDLDERAPMRLTQIAPLARQTRFDATVERGGHQGFATLLLGGVHNQAAVGRKARALIGRCVGYGADVAARKVHEVQFEGAANP
jgi:hypothetical protein